MCGKAGAFFVPGTVAAPPRSFLWNFGVEKQALPSAPRRCRAPGPASGTLLRKSKSFRPRRDPARSGGGRRRKKPGKTLAAPVPRRVLRGPRHGERGKAHADCFCRRAERLRVPPAVRRGGRGAARFSVSRPRGTVSPRLCCARPSVLPPRPSCRRTRGGLFVPLHERGGAGQTTAVRGPAKKEARAPAARPCSAPAKDRAGAGRSCFVSNL